MNNGVQSPTYAETTLYSINSCASSSDIPSRSRKISIQYGKNKKYFANYHPNQ